MKFIESGLAMGILRIMLNLQIFIRQIFVRIRVMKTV